jgi:membrane protein DedA with SNARE-associated domain
MNEPAPPTRPSGSRSYQTSLWRSLIAFGLFCLISVGLFLLRDDLPDLRQLGYGGAFIAGLLSTASVIFPLPGVIVTFALGAVMPSPLLVGLAAGLGETIGELTGYLAGYSGRAVVEDSGRYARLVDYMRRYGLIVVFVLALIPTPFFDLAGIAAGMLRFPVLLFLLACWPGKTIKATVVAMAGAGLLPRLNELLLSLLE